MKTTSILSALVAAGLLGSAVHTPADTTNAYASVLATVRDGANAAVDINEASLGYVMTKYSTSGSAAKSYFLFDVAGMLPNTNAAAKFTFYKFNASGIQHVKLWGLNQAYPTFASTVTWNTVQANELTSNDLLTDPTNTYTATLIADAVVPTTTTYEFTLPGGAGGWGKFIIGGKLVLVLSGMNDYATNNNANGLRISATNLAQLPALSFSTTAGNQPPTITALPDISLYQSQVGTQMTFTVTDDLDTPDLIYVYATSDKPSIIEPTGQVEFSPFPYGSNRWLRVTAGTQVGEATITVHAQDIYGLENVESFTVAVLADPVLTAPSLVTTLKNMPSAGNPVTVGSVDTPVSALSLVGIPANGSILPPGGIAFTGSGATRSMSLAPATDAIGVTPVSLWVTDGVNSNGTSFGFMVLPTEDSLFCDLFDYPDGFLNPVSQNFWALRTSGTTRLMVTNQQALLRSSGGSWESVLAPLAGSPYPVGGRSVFYARCNAQWTTLPRNSTGPFLHLCDSLGALLAKVHTVTNNVADGYFRLGIASGPGNNYVDLPTDYTTNVTYAIVARYDMDSGASALWVNATSETDLHASAVDVPSSSPVTSVGLRQQAGIGTIVLDDLGVKMQIRPAITGIAVTGGNVEITFSGSAKDTPAKFLVLHAANAAGPYTETSASVSSPIPGTFRAVVPTAGDASFYRVARAPETF